MASYDIEVPEPDGLRVINLGRDDSWRSRPVLVFGRECSEFEGRWIDGHVILVGDEGDDFREFEARVAEKLRAVLS